MSGLTDFKDFFRQYTSIITTGTATTAAVLITGLAGITPPWPPSLIAISAISQLMVLAYIFQHHRRSAKATINRVLRTSLVLSAVFFILYVFCFSILVYEMPNGDFAVRGLICSSDAEFVFGADCPLLTRDQIADAEFDPEVLWTQFGLAVGRVSLLLSWIGLLLAVVSFLGTFIAYQRRSR